VGDPKKQRKKYVAPLHPWRRDQLEEELRLMGEYGLRNKRELWRAKTLLSKIRGIARSVLAVRGPERERNEKQYITKLSRIGLLSPDAKIDSVLDLEVKDLLERRLQTFVYRSGLAKSMHMARQLVTHGHIAIGNRVVTIPGYLVGKAEQDLLSYANDSPMARPDHPVRKAIPERAPTAPRPTTAPS